MDLEQSLEHIENEKNRKIAGSMVYLVSAIYDIDSKINWFFV